MAEGMVIAHVCMSCAYNLSVHPPAGPLKTIMFNPRQDALCGLPLEDQRCSGSGENAACRCGAIVFCKFASTSQMSIH